MSSIEITANHMMTPNKDRKKILRNAGSFDYKYPNELDLKPGSEIHDKLVEYGLDLVERALDVAKMYHPMWKQMDWTRTGYVKPEDANPKNSSKDRDREIVIPLTYRNREMYLAAMHAIFIQDPIFRFRPFPGAESLLNAAVFEYIIQRQALWFNLGLHLRSVWGDGFTYGVGVGGVKWSRRKARKPVDREVTDITVKMVEKLGGKASRRDIGKIIRDLEEVTLYEGSELQPWDMYNTFWDPNVSPNNFNQAEYIGRIYRSGAMDLLRRERDPEERRFNGWYVKALAERSEGYSRYNQKNESGRNTRTGMEGIEEGRAREYFNPADFVYIELDIIPSDWGVGDETWPVRYALEIACDEVITAFHPTDMAHGEFNAVMCAPNTDGQDVVPISHLLTTYGIQKHIDVVARCTAASLVKNINGGWTIVNQNVLNWDDVMNNDQPSKLIRLALPYATPEMLQSALIQIQHPDMTAPHMQHVSDMMNIASDGNGTLDIMGGRMDQMPDRPTARGINAAVAGASSRMTAIAYVIGSQMMSSLGWQFAYNFAQFGKEKQTVELAGRFADRIRREIGIEPTQQAFEVSADELSMHFDMEPYTGAMPQTNDVAGLSEIIKVALGIPEIALQATDGFPWQGLLKQYVRKLGYENLDDFAPTQMGMSTMPDQQVMDQMQAGNLVPLQEGM